MNTHVESDRTKEYAPSANEALNTNSSTVILPASPSSFNDILLLEKQVQTDSRGDTEFNETSPKEPNIAATNSLREFFDVTVLTVTKPQPDQVGKLFWLNGQGELEKDTRGEYHKGTAVKHRVGDLVGLQRLIKGLASHQMLIAGANTQTALNITPKGQFRRDSDTFPFASGPALMVIDSDDLNQQDSGLTILEALREACPAFQNTAVVQKPSSSSNIRTTSGVVLRDLRGLHTYVIVKNGLDIPRALYALHVRLWLKGYGRSKFAATGALLIRSYVDQALKTPSQPIYARAHLGEGLEYYDNDVNVIEGFDENSQWMLDSEQDIPNLSEEEQKRFDELKAQFNEAHAEQIYNRRTEYIKLRLKEFVARGVDKSEAEGLAQALASGKTNIDLWGDAPIVLSDGTVVTVTEILNNEALYHGKTCRDPAEPSYGGSQVARIYLNEKHGDNKAKKLIKSFAHGERYFYLHREEPPQRSQTKEQAKNSAQVKVIYERLVKAIDSTNDEVELVISLAAEISACDQLPAAMIKMLLKRISKKAKVSLSSLEQGTEAFSSVRASKDDDHLKAAKEVVTSYGEGNLLGCASGIWTWHSSGTWKRLDDRELKARIHAVAGSNELTSSIVNSIMDLVKTEIFVAGHHFNEFSTNAIAVANGVLEYASGAWTLQPHCREDFRTTLIPVTYDPQAEALRFELFLLEVFEGVSDAQDRIRVIKQGFGYTLLASCHLERFFMLIGSGANGKSVLLSTLSSLVGAAQVTSVQPNQFDNRFQRAHLEGKLANIITEIAEGAEIADAQLKSLVSGELNTAEHKFQNPFDFRPIATHWFGTNHLPHTRDFSDALFRRAILVEFPRKFAEHERDPNLTKKLGAEMSGILNFAIEGLTELFETNQFTVPQSSKELAVGWRMEADQANQFVEECGVVDATSSVEIGQIYTRYKEWASEAGIGRTLSKKSLSQRLVRLGFTQGRNKSSRQIHGIKLIQTHWCNA